MIGKEKLETLGMTRIEHYFGEIEAFIPRKPETDPIELYRGLSTEQKINFQTWVERHPVYSAERKAEIIEWILKL